MKQPDIDWEIEVPATDEDLVYRVYLKNSFMLVEVGVAEVYSQSIRRAARNLRAIASDLERELEKS